MFGESQSSFSDNFELADLVEIQRLYEDGKSSICIYNRDYTLFKERSFYFTLLHKKCFKASHILHVATVSIVFTKN